MMSHKGFVKARSAVEKIFATSWRTDKRNMRTNATPRPSSGRYPYILGELRLFETEVSKSYDIDVAVKPVDAADKAILTNAATVFLLELSKMKD